jgi:hypothetical protein
MTDEELRSEVLALIDYFDGRSLIAEEAATIMGATLEGLIGNEQTARRFIATLETVLLHKDWRA